ncbi:MAG: ribosome-binding factor A [Methyloligella sp.]|jgi:ribosome-binding factor A|nr:MAG: ribosome-binding factor A [Methyloligella sp.]
MGSSKPSGNSERRAKKGPSQRQLRVAENLRHELSQIFTRIDIRDEDLLDVIITVSEIRTSPDMRQATVYVMPLGGKNKDIVVEALSRHRKFLRGELSRKVTLKYMPELHFRLDETFDESGRISDVLNSKKVAQDLGDKPADQTEADTSIDE